MFNFIFQLLQIAVRFWFEQKTAALSLQLKIQFTKGILAVMQSLRQSVVLLFLVGAGVVLLGLAISCLLIGLFLWLPWDMQTKAIVLMGLGVLGVGTAVVLIQRGFSEKKWLEAFAINEILENILKTRP